MSVRDKNRRTARGRTGPPLLAARPLRVAADRPSRVFGNALRPPDPVTTTADTRHRRHDAGPFSRAFLHTAHANTRPIRPPRTTAAVFGFSRPPVLIHKGPLSLITIAATDAAVGIYIVLPFGHARERTRQKTRHMHDADTFCRAEGGRGCCTTLERTISHIILSDIHKYVYMYIYTLSVYHYIIVLGKTTGRPRGRCNKLSLRFGKS